MIDNMHFRHMRVYDPRDCVVFWTTTNKWGEFQNFHRGFPLVFFDTEIGTSEALYQALKFTNHPDIQEAIIDTGSPNGAKAVAYQHPDKVRSDWDDVRVKVMCWVCEQRLRQHDQLIQILDSTSAFSIVERSRHDDFWGAKMRTDGMLHGINALGRIYVRLRNHYRSERPKRWIKTHIEDEIPNFRLLGHDLVK